MKNLAIFRGIPNCSSLNLDPITKNIPERRTIARRAKLREKQSMSERLDFCMIPRKSQADHFIDQRDPPPGLRIFQSSMSVWSTNMQ